MGNLIDMLLSFKPKDNITPSRLMMLMYYCLSREGYEKGMSLDELRDFVFDWLGAHDMDSRDCLQEEMWEEMER